MNHHPHVAAEKTAAATSKRDPILRVQPACQYIGVGRTTLYSLTRSGALEPPLKIGPRARGWRQSTLDDFLDSLGPAGSAA